MSSFEETTAINRHSSPRSTTRRSLRRTNSPATPRRLRPTPKPVEVFHKSYSEPMIFCPTAVDDGGGRSFGSDEGEWFCRVNTLDDVILCSDDVTGIVAYPLTQMNTQGYRKDAKVMITVTVEGSPGPVKTVVKLGANVDDTIKLVVQKYGDEGRCPRLDKDAASFFDLYVSYFSLQSLDRTYAIGDVGTRSFYLRKSRMKSDGYNNMVDDSTTSLTSSLKYESVQPMSSPSKQLISPVVIFPPFIARKLNKIVRRVHKLFILLGCLCKEYSNYLHKDYVINPTTSTKIM